MSDSYVGFDKEILLDFELVKDDPNREIEEYSKETLDAVKKPGLLQSVMDQQIEESSSEEEEEDDDKPKAKTNQVTADDEMERLRKKDRKSVV